MDPFQAVQLVKFRRELTVTALRDHLAVFDCVVDPIELEVRNKCRGRYKAKQLWPR